MRSLLGYFGDAAQAWHAPSVELQAAGLSPRIVAALDEIRSSDALEKACNAIQFHDVRVYTWEDADYPAYLNEIEHPPPVLYVKGTLLQDDSWAVAIVGTRRISAYGRQVTDEIASGLAHGGVTVVSGLARGVDAVAHQAVLKAGGRTIAVLGSGIDRVYPPEHRRLAEQITGCGALVSDYPLGTPPEGPNFPPRNRIISGLSRAVVVIEAGESSGSLITAAFAAEQGREVFAVPGSIYAPMSRGANLLIQQGARLVLKPQDILAVLHLGKSFEQQQARAALPADATEAQLFALLGMEPMHIDEIRASTELPIEKVSAALVMMELKGLVRQVGGMRYVAVREDNVPYDVN
jgi:DNA processing protein